MIWANAGSWNGGNFIWDLRKERGKRPSPPHLHYLLMPTLGSNATIFKSEELANANDTCNIAIMNVANEYVAQYPWRLKKNSARVTM